jgi:predicted dehydrogenase
MKNKVAVGIIGLGGVGERVLKEFMQHDEIRIVSICDNNIGRIGEFSSQYQGVSLHSDYKDVLKNDEIDLVYIAVPPKLHHEIALNAIKVKKHVLCEKPLANSLVEAEEMFAAAQESGVIHALNFPTFYRGEFNKLEQIVKDNMLGEITRIEVNTYFHEWPRPWQQNSWIASREQGGFIREVMPHYIQLIQYLFGAIYRIVSKVTYPSNPENCETAITAIAELEDRTPILFNGVSNIAMKELIHFTIYGTKGTVSLRNWNELYFGGENEIPQKVDLPVENQLFQLIDNVVRAIKGRDSILLNFEIGYEVQKVLEELLSK